MQGIFPKGGLEKGGRELTRVQVTVGNAVSAVSSDPWAGRTSGASQKDTPRHTLMNSHRKQRRNRLSHHNQSLQELICLK